MNGRELVAALHEGQRVYGTLITCTAPYWPGAIRNVGLDFVFIDTEHIPIDRHTLTWMCQVYRANGLAPIVRIPEPDPYRACMALDGGASGIIAPYVETVEQVRALRGAVKWRPLKGQRLADIIEGRIEPEPALVEYLGQRNSGNALIINIESVPAIKALDELLAVPQVDAVLIGPHDLSISLGLPEQYRHPTFDRAVRDIIRRARARGIGAGIHFSTGIDQEIAWAQEEGANLIIHSSDISICQQGMLDDFGTLRKALDGTRPGDKGEEIQI